VSVRRLVPSGLRLRLTIPFVLATMIVLVGLALVLGDLARNVYINRLEDELASQATILADDTGRAMQTGSDADVRQIVTSLTPLIPARMTIIDPSGKVIADSEADPATMANHSNRPEIIQARSLGLGESTRHSATIDRDFLYVAVPIAQEPGAVARVAVSLADVDTVVSRIQRYILIAAVIAMLIVIPLVFFIADRIARPLYSLRRQAIAVARGDLSARVTPDATPEIGDVGRAFNTMTVELQRSRETIERTSVRLEAILSGLSDGVVLTDESGNVIRLNEAAAQMFDATEEHARGRHFMQVARDHELARQLRDILAGRSPNAVTIEHGLSRTTLQSWGRVIEGANERFGLVVLRDVTRLRQLETVRREFVANVSHELRTPLTSIRALAETLEAGAIDDRALTEDFLGRILREVDRLTALVEDLLDMARLEAGRAPLQLELVDPAELIEKGAERLRPQVARARLTLDVQVGEGMVPIPVDRVRVEQVLLNLIHNAIKFTPPGGAITIDVTREGRFVAVTVRDTGVGIASVDQARLFERFFKSDRSRHSEGTGLGLAIAKHIIELHGGEISVESTPGGGASFTFTLPIRASSDGNTRGVPALLS
jgi:two-component system phosphate regulon sensor histidine kinase PhoR